MRRMSIASIKESKLSLLRQALKAVRGQDFALGLHIYGHAELHSSPKSLSFNLIEHLVALFRARNVHHPSLLYACRRRSAICLWRRCAKRAPSNNTGSNSAVKWLSRVVVLLPGSSLPGSRIIRACRELRILPSVQILSGRRNLSEVTTIWPR
jgi:hypothetical protein